MRHKKVQKRQISPDLIYNNLLVAKLINGMMKDGKKTTAEKKLYSAMKLIEEKKLDPMDIFDKAISNIAPKVEVKARRVGGANYQVPIEVRAERKNSLAIKWLLEAATKKANKEFHTFEEKLASELISASNNEGEAVRKKEIMHKQAEANKAFSHFRW